MSSPAPLPDDAAKCDGCGKRIRGVSARRFFRRHVVNCRGSVELRYASLVDLIGPPQ